MVLPFECIFHDESKYKNVWKKKENNFDLSSALDIRMERVKDQF